MIKKVNMYFFGVEKLSLSDTVVFYGFYAFVSLIAIISVIEVKFL